MPKVKRRRPNTIVQKRQALNTYVPVVRLRKHSLSPFDSQLMRDAFLPNDQCVWESTSNCRVRQFGGKYQIVALKRVRIHDKIGKRVYSIRYDNAISAENNAFDFRYSLESKTCKAKLDAYKINIALSLAGSVISSQPMKDIHKPPTLRIRSLPSSVAKQYSMSGSLHLNLKVGTSSNPNNCQPNSSFLLNRENQSLLECHVTVIQRVVRNRYVKHAAKMMKQTIKDQAYRKYIVRYLSNHIASDTCAKLLLGAENDEILSSFSTFDRNNARMKAIHIADALQSLIRFTEENKAVTWIKCCEIAIEKNYKKIKRARTIADWYLQLHQTNKLQFRRLERGRGAYFMKSPFAEDESLSISFKAWARQDLEHLSVKKSWDFINLKLLSNWTAKQLETNRISYPVSEYIISRWMKEAGFKYELHKKSYYFDRHEDDDVVSYRKTYLIQQFNLEILEYCWV